MPRERGKLLIAQSYNRPEEFKPLERYADIFWLDRMSEEEQARILPLVDCLFSHGWPKALDSKVPLMKSLRFLQTGNAGVNTVRFDLLDKKVVVCSNVGGYSDEVAEFTVGLMMAAGKSIVGFDRELRSGDYRHPTLDVVGRRVAFFRGKVVGIVGYGGIGKSTARMVRGFGMKVLAYGRHPVKERGVTGLRGPGGLTRLLRESDVVILAVPLTKATKGLIGAQQLAAMKKDAILVNVARGEVVQKEAVFAHLKANPGFSYATDVWWPGGDGRETFAPDLPFNELPNFIGTPHASGPTAIITGTMAKGVVENFTRYFQGRPLKNVVDRSEYQ